MQPQAAYVAFVVGYRQKFNYLFRTIKDLDEFLAPLENAIRFKFIPSLCDGRHCNDTERKILALPTKSGGLGIINVFEEAKFQYETSYAATSSLRDRIVTQSEEPVDFENAMKIIRSRKKNRQGDYNNTIQAVQPHLTPIERKALEISMSPGAYAWLTTLPLKEEHYILNKQEFFDAIFTRYGWTMRRLPATCACHENFTIEHALSWWFHHSTP